MSTTTYQHWPPGDNVAKTASTTLSAPGATPWLALADNILAQLTGPATAITAVLERSARDPSYDGSTAAAAPVAQISGNPSTGLAPTPALEPAVAWWRVRVTALTGASVAIDLSGRGAEFAPATTPGVADLSNPALSGVQAALA